MNAKRLATAYGGVTGGKLRAMMHARTDVAAIENFFAEIGAELALIICKSVRGIVSYHVNRRWYPEILFWLIACYNNPMFAKTYHIGWKYRGYENDTLTVRSQRGRRFRFEMIQFLDYYTLVRDGALWTRREPWSLRPSDRRPFSFMDVEPSYCYISDLVRELRWCTLRGRLQRFPYPSHVVISVHIQHPPSTRYEVWALYYTESNTRLVNGSASAEVVRKFIDANYHIKFIV